MARRPAAPPEPQPVPLALDQMQRGIDLLKRRIVDLEAFDPQSVQNRWPPEVAALEAAIDEALTVAFGYNGIQYQRHKYATRLDNGTVHGRPHIYGESAYLQLNQAPEARRFLAVGKQKALLLLRRAIQELEEEIVYREQHAIRASPGEAVTPRDLWKASIDISPEAAQRLGLQ
jgi:hypothetical protein